MSRYVNLQYQLEQQRKREIYLERISITTKSFALRYSSILETMRKEKIDSFIREDFRIAERDLNQVESLLNSDPESARRKSKTLGSWIGGLPEMARNIRREAEVRAEEERKALKKEYSDFLQGVFPKFEDPVVRDFAFKKCRELLKQSQTTEIDQTNVEFVKSKIQNEISNILEKAEKEAKQWKERKKAEASKKIKKEAELSSIQIQKEVLKESIPKNKPNELKEMISQLDTLESLVVERAEIEPSIKKDPIKNNDISLKLEEISAQSEKTILDEEYRKETVKAVYQILKKAGFIVGKPQLSKGEDGGEVIIKGQRIAGQESIFKVKLDGAMTYKFHRYEGSACKDDIKKVLPKLQEVYGIQLSDERVLWENPDRISANAKPIDFNEDNKNQRS